MALRVPLARALRAETKVESGTSQTKREPPLLGMAVDCWWACSCGSETRSRLSQTAPLKRRIEASAHRDRVLTTTFSRRRIPLEGRKGTIGKCVVSRPSFGPTVVTFLTGILSGT